MELGEKTLSRQQIYKGRIINVHVDDVELEDGSIGKREVVDHPGGVGVAALTDKGELLFVRQFRYPYGKTTLELPAGKLEPGEDPFLAVQRELMEETGCTGRDWQYMGEMYPTPGYCGEILRLWFCYVDRDTGSQQLDSDEFLDALRIPLDRAVDMVMNNELPDGKTQALVLKAAELVRRRS